MSTTISDMICNCLVELRGWKRAQVIEVLTPIWPLLETLGTSIKNQYKDDTEKCKAKLCVLLTGVTAMIDKKLLESCCDFELTIVSEPKRKRKSGRKPK